MTTPALLTDLTARGVRVTAAAGRLSVKAPRGVLTAADRAGLARHKSDLVAALAPAPAPAPVPASEFQAPTDCVDWVPGVGPVCSWPTAAPTTPRPDAIPVYGLTQAGHVVELPRNPGAGRRDSLRLVTTPGWPAWFPAAEADEPGAGDDRTPPRARPKDRDRERTLLHDIAVYSRPPAEP
jgi:hypothetical protein